MEVPGVLIKRIFRDVLNSGEAAYISEQLPESLPFELPLSSSTLLLVVIHRAELSYDFLFKSSSPFEHVQAFYLNVLRGLGWERWYGPNDERNDPIGFVPGQSLRSKVLQFCHPQQRRFLRLQPIPEEITGTASIDSTFHINVGSVIYQPGGQSPWQHRIINVSPTPILLTPVDSTLQGGNTGGSNFNVYAVQGLQSPHTTAELIEHYAQQLKQAGWQEQETHVSEHLAHTLWSLVDPAGEHWQLLLCIATTHAPTQYTTTLTVQSLRGLTRVYPSPETAPRQSDLPVELVTILLQSLNLETQPELHLSEEHPLPDSLESLPRDAQILGSLSTHRQWRFFMDIPGSPQTVFARTTQHLTAQGWELAHSRSPLQTIGFMDSSFYPLVPALFYHPDYPNHRLSFWSRPARPGWIDVEIEIDVEENISSRLRDSNPGSIHEPFSYPKLELRLPPESVVYPGEGTYKPDRFRDSIYVKTALSQGELMRYYEAQMVRLGWNRQLAQQNSSRVTLSSWIWTSENQQAWQCLLWIVAQAFMPSSYSAHLQVVHLGS